MGKEILVYDIEGKEQDKIEFDVQIPRKDISSKAYSCVIKALRQNWRQGTVKCKNRSEVSFSKRKPWRQKGTGRARAGTAASPLWRKGGVIFGPQPRIRKLFVNRKQVALVLNNIFYEFYDHKDDKNIFCIDCDFAKVKPSTKKVFKILKQLGISDKKNILFLPFDDEANFLAFRNIPKVKIFSFDQPNAFDLSNGDCWFFLKRDADLFKKMVLLWS